MKYLKTEDEFLKAFIKKNIKKNLKKLRIDRRITGAEVSEHTLIPKSSIHHYECVGSISIERLEKLSRFYEIDPWDILCIDKRTYIKLKTRPTKSHNHK